jgi:4-amino-4-deoxy-L-arabinose transferase-like glycosyltransferase
LLLRVLFMVAYQPALIGYSDSGVYLTGAKTTIWWDLFRTVGYSLWVRELHGISSHLWFTIAIQHLLGVATALLFYGAVRRIGGPPWLALAPAAAVLLIGAHLFLEHALLSESVFCLLEAGAMYCAARSVRGQRAPYWALAAGLIAGLSVAIRVAGLVLLPALALWMLLSGERAWRPRLARFVATAAAALAVVLGYALEHEHNTGQFALTRTGAYNFYGRVAPFADCSKFTPPEGTEFLCESRPPSQRLGAAWYIFGPSPAVTRVGEPQISHPSKEGVSKIWHWSLAAAEGQPLDYANAVLRDLGRYVAPDSFKTDPTGLTPQQLQDFLTNPFWVHHTIVHGLEEYYSDGAKVEQHGLYGSLTGYEKLTRVEGPLFVVLVLLAIAGPFLLEGRLRQGSLLMLLIAAAFIVGPVVVFYYDYRFALPAWAPLFAAAAYGGYGIRLRLAARRWPASAEVGLEPPPSYTSRGARRDNAGGLQSRQGHIKSNG